MFQLQVNFKFTQLSVKNPGSFRLTVKIFQLRIKSSWANSFLSYVSSFVNLVQTAVAGLKFVIL